jgi:iron complex outermembrane receptor protein
MPTLRLAARLLAGVSVLASTALPGPGAWAQTQNIEEIVVTVRKRAETLLEVPMAITALNSDEIRRRSATGLQDVAAATPGLTYFENLNGTLGSPVIRGLSQTVIIAPDRNVSLFYHGVFLSAINASNFQLLDMERVEVAKGPQSALYGRNSFAGAINYVPASANTQKFSGYGEVTAGSDKRYGVRAGLNVPVSNAFAVRVAAGYDSFDGTIKNVLAPGNNAGGYSTFALSWDMLAAPSDNLKVKLFGFYTDDKHESSPNFEFDNTCGRAATPPFGPTFFCGPVPTSNQVAIDPRSKGNQAKGEIVGTEIQYDFGAATATASASYVNLYQSLYADRDFQTDATGGTLYNVLRGGVVVGQQRFRSYAGNGPDNTKDYNAELRIASPQNQRLRWLAGTSYYAHTGEATTLVGIDSTGLAAGSIISTYNSQAVISTNPFPGTKISDLTRKDKAVGIFGTADFDITDRFGAGAELRWDREKRQNWDRLNVKLQEVTYKYWTTRMNLNYKVNDEVRTYVSAAKGFISGFFNGLVDAAAGNLPYPQSLQAYKPSTNWTYEAGIKSSLFDNTLVANLAVYYIEYKDLQIQSFPPAPFVTAITVNTGKATSKGAELELNWKATKQLTLGGAYGYSDPKYGDGTIDLSLARYCGDGSLCTTNASGKSLTRTSNHTLSGSAQWEDNLVGDWNYYLRADLRYQSKQFTRSNNLQWIPGRTLVNARIGVSNGPIEVALWGKNLFDKRYDVIAIAQPRYSSILNFITNVAIGEGRTLGATASYRF